ncbi:MAG: hypothetical protein ACFFCW_33310 [Candidatus Hodarchaeota archaeon]
MTANILVTLSSFILAIFVLATFAVERPLRHRTIPVFAVILLGIVLRLWQYLANRALWQDEAMLSLNIVNRSYVDLVRPLDYNQGAPILFTWAEKTMVNWLGVSEYSLRLVPLVSGIFSIGLFYIVAKNLIGSKALLLALALFSTSGALIYYASESKQYATDVTVTLSIVAVVYSTLKRGLTFHRSLVLVLLGVGSTWLSHPAVFVLASGALILLCNAMRSRNYQRTAYSLVIGVSWGGSFVSNYFVSLKHLANNSILYNFWETSFAPFPPQSKADFFWYCGKSLRFFTDPGGFQFPAVMAPPLLVIAGVIGLWRDSRKTSLFVLWLPLVFAWAASILGKYPLVGRFMLFFLPSVILTIAYGIATLWQHTGHHSRWVVGTAIVFLLFQPVLSLIKDFPRYREEIKPVVNYIDDHYLLGDQVYVYWAAEPAFLFYAKDRFNGSYIIGVKSFRDPFAYMQDMKYICGLGRVWVLFSAVYGQQRTHFLQYLDRSGGVRRDQIEGQGSFAYLYDLSGVECPAY